MRIDCLITQVRATGKARTIMLLPSYVQTLLAGLPVRLMALITSCDKNEPNIDTASMLPTCCCATTRCNVSDQKVVIASEALLVLLLLLLVELASGNSAVSCSRDTEGC